MSYQIFKSWKNIPDIFLSIDTSIRQQLINTKTYRKQKLQESVDETNCRVCSNDQETVPHILCGCSQIAQTLYKDRHDQMLRPLYHSVLEKYEFSESQYSQPWYKQSHPVHVWRMIKRTSCGIFHGIWKNARETEPTSLI